MKVLEINSDEESVTEVETTGDYEYLKNYTGGYIENGHDWTQGSRVAVWVNEAGRSIQGSRKIFGIPGITHGFLYGRAVITGLTQIGEVCSTKYSAKEIKEKIIYGTAKDEEIILTEEGSERYRSYGQREFNMMQQRMYAALSNALDTTDKK